SARPSQAGHPVRATPLGQSLLPDCHQALHRPCHYAETFSSNLHPSLHLELRNTMSTILKINVQQIAPFWQMLQTSLIRSISDHFRPKHTPKILYAFPQMCYTNTSQRFSDPIGETRGRSITHTHEHLYRRS